jgi:hypothetical protein
MKMRSGKTRDTVHSASDFAQKPRKKLNIAQIRDRVGRLLHLPDGAPLPDFSDLTVGDRFAILLRLVPDDQWEQLLGRSKNHIRKYESGTEIPLTVVAALAAETEVPLDWIVLGSAMDRRPPLVYVSVDRPAADPDDVPIQKLAFKVSAGNGAILLDDAAEYVRFPRFILESHGVAPQNARLMIGSGESMRPTINDGDLMLVDVSPTAAQIVEGKVYVFSVGDDAFVKRLRKMGDQVMMISDNRELFPDEQPVPQHQPMRIYGRVKWAGRSL